MSGAKTKSINTGAAPVVACARILSYDDRIMSTGRPTNRVRQCRTAHGWSQQELASRAGLSRTGVSAIESGRLVPSVAAALALAKALGSSVEELFQSGEPGANVLTWAEPTRQHPTRFWTASVGGRRIAYAVEDSTMQSTWHDGVSQVGRLDSRAIRDADRTLVVASCDPAAGLLAAEYARMTPFRMLVLRRSSREALRLLASGVAHLAGVHFASTSAAEENLALIREIVGKGYRILRVARWEEGLAVSPLVKGTTVRTLLRSRLRWVGREEGSAARACLDEILAGKPSPRRMTRDHRGVAQAIADGWADAGVCLRLASEEAGLRFMLVRHEYYDLCFAAELESEPRVAAMIHLVRSADVRQKLGDLPGYDCRQAGAVRDA
jgi:molybdate-binding protein/transcriptional regulator with XRE-family HTH domain